jgi:hypothetical protein
LHQNLRSNLLGARKAPLQGQLVGLRLNLGPLRRAARALAGLREAVVAFVARIPTRVETKLLVAFLAMVALLVALGAVGLSVLGGAQRRTNDLIALQRKIAVYRQVQLDTTTQLYEVSSAMLLSDDRALAAALRKLNQFDYDLERLQFVTAEDVALSGQVRQTYDQFVAVVSQVVELYHAGRIAEARQIQLRQAGPLADRLERLTNQLVNRAEAEMLTSITAGRQSYAASQTVVVVFLCGSVILALALGYVISWSLIGPVTEVAARCEARAQATTGLGRPVLARPRTASPRPRTFRPCHRQQAAWLRHREDPDRRTRQQQPGENESHCHAAEDRPAGPVRVARSGSLQSSGLAGTKRRYARRLRLPEQDRPREAHQHSTVCAARGRVGDCDRATA